jgi:hypothetical protein
MEKCSSLVGLSSQLGIVKPSIPGRRLRKSAFIEPGQYLLDGFGGSFVVLWAASIRIIDVMHEQPRRRVDLGTNKVPNQGVEDHDRVKPIEVHV